MNIQHEQNDRRGKFFILTEGKQKALMTYSVAGSNKIIIDHTEVDPSLQGQGVGYQLLEAAVKCARGQGIKILPLCPFAKAVFDKTAEYDDIRF